MRYLLRGTIGALLAFAIAAVAAVRYMSPTQWTQILLSPRNIVAAAVAYHTLRLNVSMPEQRILWNYDVALGPARVDEIEVIYTPRIHVDPTRKDPIRPAAHMIVSPGIETHVFVDRSTFEVKRSYFAE